MAEFLGTCLGTMYIIRCGVHVAGQEPLRCSFGEYNIRRTCFSLVKFEHGYQGLQTFNTRESVIIMYI
jgi:hypothetical protein